MLPLGLMLELLNARKNRVLLVAQAALPESQFSAFKKLFLDEFGRNGLEGELLRLDADTHRSKDRNGQE